MIFYDYEVFKYDWLVVMMDTDTEQTHVFVNDREGHNKFCKDHINDIWVGCNNKHYDQYIKKSILCGLNPYDCNEWIITDGRNGWEFSNLLGNYNFIEYDVMTQIDRGLKFWEGSLGNNIKETSIDFRISRKLTEDEIQETVKYCTSDVENTINVFCEKINDFNAIMGLIEMFPDVLDITDIGRTKAQISAKILECVRTKHDDEFDLFKLPCIQLNKYKFVEQWFLDTNNHDYNNKLEYMVAGIMHTFAWGGVHAGKEKYHCKASQEHRQIWHVDVASFYPRLMIFHKLLTRNSKKPYKFRQIFDKRIELKRAGKKKEQAPLKIVINGTYGISKAPTSDAYDPRNANLICINGQLMLLDLIEHLEVIPGFELIQSNTDGLIVSLPDTDAAFNQMDDICYEWEKRCNMELEFDSISEIHQKDVNNYVFKFTDGKIERKGAYVKELSSLDYDLPIVNKALVDFMINDIPVETTIMNCNKLKEFQMIKKISNKYSVSFHGTYRYCEYEFMERLSEKCLRVFASKDPVDGGIYKQHKEKGTIEKVAGTPAHAFIHNENVNDVECPDKLDKRFYVDIARKRLVDFGYNS